MKDLAAQSAFLKSFSFRTPKQISKAPKERKTLETQKTSSFSISSAKSSSSDDEQKTMSKPRPRLVSQATCASMSDIIDDSMSDEGLTLQRKAKSEQKVGQVDVFFNEQLFVQRDECERRAKFISNISYDVKLNLSRGEFFSGWAEIKFWLK